MLNTSYVRDPSGTLVSQKGLLSTHYYLFDRLGSVVALTDGSGNAVNRYVYDPYGNPLAGTVEAVANPWQFAGGFRDAFSGYTKFGERYYDPAIGRWTQRDPSGMDANSYGYALCNPVNHVDVTGLKPCNQAVAKIAEFVSYSGMIKNVVDRMHGSPEAKRKAERSLAVEGIETASKNWVYAVAASEAEKLGFNQILSYARWAKYGSIGTGFGGTFIDVYCSFNADAPVGPLHS